VWPDRAARVERVRAHLREPGAWWLVATDGPVVVGMACAEALQGRAGPVIPGGWYLSYLLVVPEPWGEGIGGAILDAVLARRGGGATRGFTSGRTTTTSVRTVCTGAAASHQPAVPPVVRANGRDQLDQ
jgi:GNAT superfamily N-acetyltransferase